MVLYVDALFFLIRPENYGEKASQRKKTTENNKMLNNKNHVNKRHTFISLHKLC